MSYVTSLAIALAFDDGGMDSLMSYFDEREMKRPMRVDEGWEGRVAMQMDVYIAAYNYFDLAPFLERFHATTWQGHVVMTVTVEDNVPTVHRAGPR